MEHIYIPSRSDIKITYNKEEAELKEAKLIQEDFNILNAMKIQREKEENK